MSGVSEKAIYERQRRRAVMQEAQEHRVMAPWLKKAYPEVSEEFYVFFTNLKKPY
jgi:hypothetical protein